MAEKLYDLWAKRNPNWEKRFEDSIIKNFSDYGKGVTKLGEAKGKLFGAGYEVFIIAFFIGLYYGQRRKLIDDSTKIKSLGQPIQYWGNIDSVKGRKAYPKLKEFIFIALVAKTDFDFIALDKRKPEGIRHGSVFNVLLGDVGYVRPLVKGVDACLSEVVRVYKAGYARFVGDSRCVECGTHERSVVFQREISYICSGYEVVRIGRRIPRNIFVYNLTKCTGSACKVDHFARSCSSFESIDHLYIAASLESGHQ